MLLLLVCRAPTALGQPGEQGSGNGRRTGRLVPSARSRQSMGRAWCWQGPWHGTTPHCAPGDGAGAWGWTP